VCVLCENFAAKVRQQISAERVGTNVLSEEERDFINSFGSDGKPMDLEEFLTFWRSLLEYERHDFATEHWYTT